MNKSLIINEMADIEIYFLEKYDISLYENIIGFTNAVKGAERIFGDHGRRKSDYPTTEKAPEKTKEQKAAEKRAKGANKILNGSEYAEKRKQIRDTNDQKNMEKFKNSVEYKVGMQYR